MGEPTLKMLRYQQQFSFFDMAKVNDVIHFVNLTEEVLSNDLSRVFDAIVAKVEELAPRIVIVDSFRTLAPEGVANGDMTLREFVQRLATKLTSWQATTFLLGEDPDVQSREHPVFTMADGLITMAQRVSRNSMVRQVQALKMRGNAPQPGLHTIRISDDGVQAFPRMLKPIEEAQGEVSRELISTGVPGLDQMMGGGISRSGQVARLRPGLVRRARAARDCLCPAAGSVGRRNALRHPGRCRQSRRQARGARFHLRSGGGAGAGLQGRFPGIAVSAARALTGSGVTILLTVEVLEPYNEMRFSPHAISFLTHDIVLQRYFEMQGELRRFMTVVKSRARPHSQELREYTVTSTGIAVGEALTHLTGVITAVPGPPDRSS